jgi:hypothetical protein
MSLSLAARVLWLMALLQVFAMVLQLAEKIS